MVGTIPVPFDGGRGWRLRLNFRVRVGFLSFCNIAFSFSIRATLCEWLRHVVDLFDKIIESKMGRCFSMDSLFMPILRLNLYEINKQFRCAQQSFSNYLSSSQKHRP